MKAKLIIAVVLGSALLASCSQSVRFTSADNSYNRDARKATVKSNEVKRKIGKAENVFSFGASVVEKAKDYLGAPYCWGGESEDCFDCSGFVSKVFNEAGVQLPRTSYNQYDYCVKIDKDDARIGDLVFFYRKGKIGHVGIYLGGGKFIHSSSSNGVELQSLSNSYYKQTFAGFGRVDLDRDYSRK